MTETVPPTSSTGPEHESGTELGPVRQTSLAVGLIKLARPKQWLKNVLVFAAPGAAGTILIPSVMVNTAIAFAVFCLAASGTYYLNDARDVAADRVHPKKRHRPIAAGSVPLWVAYVGGGVLLVSSVVIAVVFVNWQLAAVAGIYVVTTTAYSLGLKNVAILDIFLVAAGFVLRAIAGGVATQVPISQWFLIVATFGSLLMVTGKRHAEIMALGVDAGSHRATLGKYRPEFLEHIRTTASAVTIMAYCLWAFETTTGPKPLHAGHAALFFQLSIAPFVILLYRYAQRIEDGDGGSPEEVVLGDRFLQVAGLVWALCFALGVYV